MRRSSTSIIQAEGTADPQAALRFGSASVGVSVVRHARDLLPALHDTTGHIWQEYITGAGVNVESCGDLGGQPGGDFVLEETDLTQRRDGTGGDGAPAGPHRVWTEAGRKARVAGPRDIDLVDRDGQLFLIEFNMRFGGGYPVSHLPGAGFPELLVRMQRGERPAPHSGFALDIFMMKTLQPFGGPMRNAGAMFHESASYRA